MSRVDALPPYVFLVIDHLRRRFGMEFPAGGDLVAKAAGEGAEARAQLAVYARLVDPSVVITAQSLGALSDEVDLLTGPALACDQLPLPPDYLQTLQRAEDRGGPERTHAVLALQWLVEHGCIEPEEAAELSARWADGLVETVEQQRDLGDGSGDLAVEAMVMLAYSGHADRIRQEWVEDVLKGQRPDGAWQRHEGDQPPSEHTTVLGLWLMLELEDPSAPRSSWIPQP